RRTCGSDQAARWPSRSRSRKRVGNADVAAARPGWVQADHLVALVRADTSHHGVRRASQLLETRALKLMEPRVDSAMFEQRPVRAALAYPAMIDDEDHVG